MEEADGWRPSGWGKRGKLLQSDREDDGALIYEALISQWTLMGRCDGCKLEMKGMLIVLKSEPCACARASNAPGSWGAGGGGSGPDAIHS